MEIHQHSPEMQKVEGLSNNGTHHLTRKEVREIHDAIRRRDKESLLKYIAYPKVNYSKDPLLSAMLAYGSEKDMNLQDLIIQLLDKTLPEHLKIRNDVGDTALHVAVANGEDEVAAKMIDLKNDLVHVKNYKGQTPLHKAALFGQKTIFWMLMEKQSDHELRTDDGSNVLHCAITGKNPELALEIAEKYGELIFGRNSNSLTPLQLLLTIPRTFPSSLHFGIVKSLIYECIPLNIARKEQKGNNRDVESQSTPQNHRVEDETDSEEDLEEPLTKTNRMNVTALWMRMLLIYILKKLSNSVKDLEQLKNVHTLNLKLVKFIAKDHEYWEFMRKGIRDSENEKDSEKNSESEYYENDLVLDYNERNDDPSSVEATTTVETQQEFQKKVTKFMVEFGEYIADHKKAKAPIRWHESPLIVGAEMGFYDFVEQILKVCPESAQYKDYEGKNVLQVAVKCGHEKIVNIINKMATESDGVLMPSMLFYQDNKAKNTILHYAAETTIDNEGPLMQMLYEIKWFEERKTAQELFTEKHKDMLNSGRQQLIDVGKTCAGLMAAVVFASSFSIPGDKDNNHNPVFIHRTAFKVFSHAYVIGLSSAACALLLFLSLLTSNYRQQDFRRSLPIKYTLAIMSFLFALLALLVSFTCNIYLNIYGGGKAQTNKLFQLIFELTFFPVVCATAMILGGSGLGVWDFIRNLFR